MATVHRVGCKEDGKSRQIIIQFVKCHHRNEICSMTKELEVWRTAGVRFTEDLATADRGKRGSLASDTGGPKS